MTLREVVHAHIPTLNSQSTIRDAVDKMDIYQFPGLVIVDETRKVLAVITEGDVCRAVAQRDSFLSLANELALTFSSKDPITANGGTEIAQALHTMLNRGLTLLPVEEDGSLSGVVLRVDLMQAMLMDAADAVSQNG
jgi:CBS domain-containing protein